jgi:hypothetical protein
MRCHTDGVPIAAPLRINAALGYYFLGVSAGFAAGLSAGFSFFPQIEPKNFLSPI